MAPVILQEEREIEELAGLLAEEQCRSLLEIGSKFGGSLWRLSHALPMGARVVAVDLPRGTKAWDQSQPSLRKCVDDLIAEGYDAHLIWGDSTHGNIVERVRRLGPFDAVFIDANHTMPFIECDWHNYGSMGKIVAFHDIAWHRAPAWIGTRIDVPRFWERVKLSYRHQEFCYCPTGNNNGIGVLWRC
jgi:predicted O-methyltransferase YrrM